MASGAPLNLTLSMLEEEELMDHVYEMEIDIFIHVLLYL